MEAAVRTLPAKSDDERLRAVLARDRRYDGLFVFGVNSTGIYCRPGCPARLPRADNVRFFGNAAEAERAGFRACQRCRPREASREEQAKNVVRRVCEYLEQNMDRKVTLGDLSRITGSSPFHLQRTFKRRVGVSPRQYAESLRLRRLRAGLQRGDSVSMALYDSGYSSSSRLYEKGPESLGMTPAIFRKGGTGVTIAYTTFDCPLGRILVAATQRGICFLSFGDSDRSLEGALFDEFPKASIQRDDAAFTQWAGVIRKHLEGNSRRLDLPLDVQATAFQMKVWNELKAIPYGSTSTYSDIAERLGNPKAVRAVARACATNPVSLIIPCHRAVRRDGTLAGYRWGLDKKAALLETERQGAGTAAGAANRRAKR